MYFLGCCAEKRKQTKKRKKDNFAEQRRKRLRFREAQVGRIFRVKC